MQKNPNVRYLACPMRQMLSKIGAKWSMLVLYLISQSSGGRIRFTELQAQMTDCSKKMLAQMLRKLVENDLVCREVTGDKAPVRVDYSLSPRGRSLMPALDGLVAWAIEQYGVSVTD